MVEFSTLAAGMQVAYVEMTNVSVTLVGNESAKVFCALFHDRQDGATFGRLIASEVSLGFSCVAAYQVLHGVLILRCCVLGSGFWLFFFDRLFQRFFSALFFSVFR